MMNMKLLAVVTPPSIYKNQFKDYDLDNYASCGYDSDNECVLLLMLLKVSRITSVIIIFHLIWWVSSGMENRQPMINVS